MRPTTPYPWTSAVASVTRMAGLLLGVALLWLGCRSEGWRTWTFQEAGLRFEVPESWSVRVMRPGEPPRPLDEPLQPSPGTTRGDGAVVTALSVLEDAAMVIFASQKDIELSSMARHMDRFIPLKDIRFEPDDKLVRREFNGTYGFEGRGVGRLASNNAPVAFRCMALDVGGEPVFVFLYAEESQQARYAPVFDKIIAGLSPTVTARPDAQPHTPTPQETTQQRLSDDKGGVLQEEPRAPDGASPRVSPPRAPPAPGGALSPPPGGLPAAPGP